MDSRSALRAAWAALMSLASIMAADVAAQNVHPDGETARWLDRHGLGELRERLWELSIEEGLVEQRSAAAEQLAKSWISRMRASGLTEQDYQGLASRLETLFDQWPQAKTLELTAAWMHLEFIRAQNALETLRADGQFDQARRLHDRFARIAEQLRPWSQQLAASVSASSSSAAAIDLARYLCGWSGYYRGVLQRRFSESTQSSHQAWSDARLWFLDLLRLDAKRDALLGSSGPADAPAAIAADRPPLPEQPYAAVEPGLLGLDVLGRSRALLGLGLCESALGRTQAAERCFHLLEQGAAVASVLDQAPHWRVQGLLDLGRWSKAEEVFRHYQQWLRSPSTPGKVSLAASMVRSAWSDGAPEPARDRLANLGLQGLLELGEYQAMQWLYDQYADQAVASSNGVEQWLRGRSIVARAMSGRDLDELPQAVASLQSALSEEQALPRCAAARCQSELAWCLYRQSQFAAATQAYWGSAVALDACNEADQAARAFWMAYVCAQQVAEDPVAHQMIARRALQELQARYPESTLGLRAAFRLARMQHEPQLSSELIERLEKLPRDDPQYVESRWDACLYWRARWEQADSADQRQAASEKLRQSAQQYWDASARATVVRRMQCVLLALDGIAPLEGEVSPNPQDSTAYTTWLARGSKLLEQVDAAERKQFHLLALRLAQAHGQAEVALAHARELSMHAEDSVQLLGWVAVAQALDALADQASPEKAPDLEGPRFEAYRELSRRYGDEVETLRRSANARVALSKFAEVAAQLEHYSDADVALRKLLEAYPDHLDYLARLARCCFAEAKHDEALPLWRRVLRGVTDQEPTWFEAKYHQIACLQYLRPDEAQQVLQQFAALYPDLGPSPWRERFQEWLP